MEQITCIDCGELFEFAETEQKFYESKGLFKPKRCKNCRIAKKARFGGDK